MAALNQMVRVTLPGVTQASWHNTKWIVAFGSRITEEQDLYNDLGYASRGGI